MIVAVVGAKKVSKQKVVEAVQNSSFKITSFIVSEKGDIDDHISDYGMSKRIEVDRYSIEWNVLDVPGAVIAENSWGKKYNKNAPMDRSNRILEDCEALIIIDDGEIEAKQCIRKSKEYDKPVYIYPLIQKSVAGMTVNAEGYIYEF